MIKFFIKDIPQDAIRHSRVIENHYLSACKGIKRRWEKDEQLEISILAIYLPRSNCTETSLQQVLASKKQPIKSPDINAITSAVLNALKGLAFESESQIVTFSIKRVYSDNIDKVGLKVTLK